MTVPVAKAWSICKGNSSLMLTTSEPLSELFNVNTIPMTVPIGGAKENIIIDRKYCPFVACNRQNKKNNHNHYDTIYVIVCFANICGSSIMRSFSSVK